MSGKISGFVWDMDLPRAEKMILLAMADHADHLGSSIFPSVRLVAWKTGYCERQVRRVIDDLEAMGVLVPTGTIESGAVTYRIDFAAAPQSKPFEPVNGRPELARKPGDISAQRQNKPGDISDKVGDISAKPGDISNKPPDISSPRIYRVPVSEPSENRHIEPSVKRERAEVSAKPPKPKNTSFPAEFVVTAEMRQWAAEKHGNVSLDGETEAFRDWHTAKGSVYADWTAAWRTWIRRSAERSPPPQQSARPSFSPPPPIRRTMADTKAEIRGHLNTAAQQQRGDYH